MRQISLRKFKNEVPDLDEVVEVSRRDPFGNIQVLGFWTPYMTAAPGAVKLAEPDPDGRVIVKPRAFSKAEQAGRRKQ